MIPSKWTPIVIDITVVNNNGLEKVCTINNRYKAVTEPERKAINKLWQHVNEYWKEVDKILIEEERKRELQEYLRLKRKLGK